MIINSGIKRVIGSTEDGGLKIFSVDAWVKDWQEKDMLDDMEMYDANYYVEDKK